MYVLASSQKTQQAAGIKFAAQQGCGVFDPRGSRQMDMQYVRLACFPRE